MMIETEVGVQRWARKGGMCRVVVRYSPAVCWRPVLQVPVLPESQDAVRRRRHTQKMKETAERV